MTSLFKKFQFNHKKISKVLNFGFFSFLILFVLISFIFNHGLIRLTGYGVYRVESDSMEPVLNIQDVVLVKRVDVESLEPKDIIIFETNYQKTSVPITERVVVIHYFESFNNGNINTYSEENINDDESYTLDKWGTSSSPYDVSEDDLIGVFIQTINIYYWLVGLFTLGTLLIIYQYYSNKDPNS